MLLGQMVIASRGIIEGNHLLRRTLETQTLITPRTGNPIAPIRPHHRHLTGSIRTEPAPLLNQILIKVRLGLPHPNEVIASDPHMTWLLE